ncbi:MAG: hypothetical protein GEU71_03920 [Actinobacteria bacterium]|nr:hypothetical protein [Actinomycetota bacterium]
MRRLTLGLMGAVLVIAGCGSEPDPVTPIAEPVPDVFELTCTEDGSTKVAETEVTVQEDGFHVRMDNQTGEPVSMNGLGWDFSEGVSTETLPTPPGPLEIACWPYSEHESGEEPPTTDISVLDPDGVWVSPEVECGTGMQQSVIFDHFFASPGRKGDPVDLARDVLHNLKADDVLERAGYPGEEQRVTVRVQRGGKTVAGVSYDLAENGGYLLSGANICDATGIRVK